MQWPCSSRNVTVTATLIETIEAILATMTHSSGLRSQSTTSLVNFPAISASCGNFYIDNLPFVRPLVCFTVLHRAPSNVPISLEKAWEKRASVMFLQAGQMYFVSFVHGHGSIANRMHAFLTVWGS